MSKNSQTYVYHRNNIPAIEDLRLTKLSTHKGEYSWEKKYEVVTQLLASGNQRLVAELSKVPYDTISTWKRQDWWEELVTQIRHQQELQLDNKLTQIIDKSLDILADRLENGEMVMNNKTGELVRKPVPAIAASRVATDLLSRQHVLRKSSTEQVEQNESIKDTLLLLASEFAKFTKQKADLPMVEEVPFTEKES